MIIFGDLTIYLLNCFFCLLCFSFWKLYFGRGHLPPGPIPLPILGNLHQLKTSSMVESLKALSEKYGPVYSLHLGLRRVVILWGYDAVKEALVDHGDDFSGRGAIPAIQTVIQDYELPFDPTLHVSNAASNVTCSVIFGKRFDYQNKDFLDLLRMINEVAVLASSLSGQLYSMYTDILEYLPGPHKEIHGVLKCLEKFVEKRVKMNQETLDPNSPRDYIDCFLMKMEEEKDNPETEFYMSQLVKSVLSLFIAGTETVSTTLRHALLLLIKYPEIEDKVIGEIDNVIGRLRIPSVEDRNKMPYTDAVIHEIQRFSDIVPLGVPHMVMRDTNFRGFTLPKGTEVYPILSSVLRDPTQFTEPDIFRPERFLDEHGNFKKSDAFMPFSAGKRICVGEGLARNELFIYITSILQNFKLKFSCDPNEIDIKPRLSGLIGIPVNYKVLAIAR
ncbi:cytochrome P450 2G1-like isoform X2 [Pleurodeles waltl]|uniref:cytochrome P450 2G1-like isoform X2 n=1 Tax=Pleurodeles waltl TaxID=8319 RepID=UPI003709AD18